LNAFHPEGLFFFMKKVIATIEITGIENNSVLASQDATLKWVDRRISFDLVEASIRGD